VIDNCEHVLDAVAQLIADLLAQPSVSVLATSREALALPGEIRWPVLPLDVPGSDEDPSPAELRQFGSVAMFAERASRASRTLVLTDDDYVAIAQICRRLDGLPLALELTAARIAYLSPRQLAGELDRRIPLTGSTARGVPGRLGSLQASIDWSYRLLSAEEQAAFGCLADLSGSFTAATFAASDRDRAANGAAGAAADGAAGAAADRRPDNSALARLAAKSLLLTNSVTGQYRVLGTIRAFAAEQVARTRQRTGVPAAG
jgi:predicted ATPase